MSKYQYFLLAALVLFLGFCAVLYGIDQAHDVLGVGTVHAGADDLTDDLTDTDVHTDVQYEEHAKAGVLRWAIVKGDYTHEGYRHETGCWLLAPNGDGFRIPAVHMEWATRIKEGELVEVPRTQPGWLEYGALRRDSQELLNGSVAARPFGGGNEFLRSTIFFTVLP